MIRICKNADKPQTLDKSYNTDEVCKQLLMDQNDKCYLCERRLTTDYQVEHFKSQANNGDLKQTWENLFVACGYCNNKKSNKYDDILDPTQYDIETIIEHSNDFVNQKAIFDSDNRTSEVLLTIKLLNLLFNGKLSYRNCREQRFYDEFIQKIEPSASIRVIKTDAVYPEVVTISKKQTVLKYGMIGFVLGLLLSSVSILIWTLGRKK